MPPEWGYKMSLVSIVIPVCNEEEAIGHDLDTILETMEVSGYEYEVIVVDDGSTDRTAQIVREREGVRLIRHPRNKGTGAARKTGVLEAKGDLVVMTDGDGSYPNQDIPRLLELFPEYDMVIGARTVEKGGMRLLRVPTKWLIRQLASFITATKIPDLNSGFRAFKKNIALKFFNILPNSHSWVGTITIAFLSNDYEVAFIPIDYYERKGKSTFHPLKDTYNYISLVILTIMQFNPLKFFLPLATSIFLLGSMKLLYDLIFLSDIRESDIMLVLTGVIVAVMGLLADLIVKEHRYRYLGLDGREAEQWEEKGDER